MVGSPPVSNTSSRRQREREARERAILTAARDLFLEKGIPATTVDDIARACDLAKGTIYLYFSSKDEIAFALLIQTTDELLLDLENSLDPSLPAVQQLERLALAYYRFFIAQPQSFRYMFIVPHEPYSGHVAEALLERWAVAGRAALGIVASLLEQAAADGDLVVEDAWSTAVALWSAITGVISIPTQEVRKSFVGSVDPEQMVLHMVRSLLRGMRPQPGV